MKRKRTHARRLEGLCEEVGRHLEVNLVLVVRVEAQRLGLEDRVLQEYVRRVSCGPGARSSRRAGRMRRTDDIDDAVERGEGQRSSER